MVFVATRSNHALSDRVAGIFRTLVFGLALRSQLMGAAGSIQETTNVLLFLAFTGGWIWALLAAIRGGRGGLIACLILALLPGVVSALVTYAVFCPQAAEAFLICVPGIGQN